MRVWRCCFDLVVRRFWILEGTLFAWPFPRVKCSELIFLSLLVWSVVSEGPIRRPERGGGVNGS
jgi:hypothetical protein